MKSRLLLVCLCTLPMSGCSWMFDITDDDGNGKMEVFAAEKQGVASMLLIQELKPDYKTVVFVPKFRAGRVALPLPFINATPGKVIQADIVAVSLKRRDGAFLEIREFKLEKELNKLRIYFTLPHEDLDGSLFYIRWYTPEMVDNKPVIAQGSFHLNLTQFSPEHKVPANRYVPYSMVDFTVTTVPIN